MSKPASVPAAQRCAFAAAVHLIVHEPARFPYTDARYDGSRFNLYVSTPPAIGAPQRERDAFYDAPDLTCTGPELAEMVRNAYVSIGAPVGQLAGARWTRTHGKSGGWLVFDDAGRLIYVGRNLADVREVMGMPAPVVPDHSAYVMRVNVRKAPTLKGGRYGAPIVRTGGGEVLEVVELAALPSSRVEVVEVAEVVPIRKPRAHKPAAATTAPDPAPVVEVVEVVEVPASVEVAEHAARVEGGSLPVEVVDWLARLVHPPKRAYAEMYALHKLAGGPCPADPGEGWAGKARARFDRLARKAEQVSA